MAALWAVVSGWLAQLFGVNVALEVIKWIAFRGLMLTLFVTIMPIIFHNLLIWGLRFGGSIMTRYMDLVGMPEGFEHQLLTLTGLGGYLANCFQIPQCISILMTALTARMLLNTLSRLPLGRII